MLAPDTEDEERSDIPHREPPVDRLTATSLAALKAEATEACAGRPSTVAPCILPHPRRLVRSSPTTLKVITPTTQQQYATVYVVERATVHLRELVQTVEGIPVPIAICPAPTKVKHSDLPPVSGLPMPCPDAQFVKRQERGDRGVDIDVAFAVVVVVTSEGDTTELQSRMRAYFREKTVSSCIFVEIINADSYEIDLELRFFGRSDEGVPDLDTPRVSARLSKLDNILISVSVFRETSEPDNTVVFLSAEDAAFILRRMRAAVRRDAELAYQQAGEMLALAEVPGSSSRRAIHAPAAVERRIPQPRGPYTDPSALLSVSKRCLESYADKFEDWPALFSKTSAELRDAGMTVKESRYLLWLLERYRQGHDPAKIAIPPTPKKTIRGHGPRVQNGIRIR
ncbi:hypothetical protein JCM10207_001640 [Rhodosporidiobolus poonsookiae]